MRKHGNLEDVRLTKQKIRSKILLRLKTQKEAISSKKSRIIKEKLFRVKAFKKAKNVMFYIALKGEVNTAEMIKEAKKIGKIVTVPVCKKNRITIRPCILDDNAVLKKGPYGVCEPALERLIHLKELDLVIAPGLAFDKKGKLIFRKDGKLNAEEIQKLIKTIRDNL